nr:uncharacterized protein LOC124495074 isoform X2 [Dermatophagoides farinae]
MIRTIQSILSMNPYIHSSLIPESNIGQHLQDLSDVSIQDNEHRILPISKQIRRPSTSCHRQLPSLPHHYHHHQRSTPTPSPPTLMVTNSGCMVDNLCGVTSSMAMMTERPTIAVDSQDMDPYLNDNDNYYQCYEQKLGLSYFRQSDQCLMMIPFDQRNVSPDGSDELIVVPRRHSSAMTTVSTSPFRISNRIHCTRDLSPRSKTNNNNNNKHSLSLNDVGIHRRPSMPSTFHILPVNDGRRRQSHQHSNNLITTTTGCSSITTTTLSSPCLSPPVGSRQKSHNHMQLLMSHDALPLLSPSETMINRITNETFNPESIKVEQVINEHQQLGEQNNDEIDLNDPNLPATSINIDRHNLLQIPSIGHESVDPNESPDQLSEYWPDETWLSQGHHHLPVRRHRSLPATSFTSTPSFGISVRANQQRSSSFRVRSNNRLIHQEPNGRWRIKVKKSKPFLGIAIEGGSNVSAQSQPRIINIQEGGAAAENLHVGHIILEVDGHSTQLMNHAQVAQMIAHAYYNTPEKDYVEFLVREKSRNEFDLRRSSFMLLNNSFE